MNASWPCEANDPVHGLARIRQPQREQETLGHHPGQAAPTRHRSRPRPPRPGRWVCSTNASPNPDRLGRDLRAAASRRSPAPSSTTGPPTPCSSTSRARTRRAVCRCLRGASRSARSISSISVFERLQPRRRPHRHLARRWHRRTPAPAAPSGDAPHAAPLAPGSTDSSTRWSRPRDDLLVRGIADSSRRESGASAAEGSVRQGVSSGQQLNDIRCGDQTEDLSGSVDDRAASTGLDVRDRDNPGDADVGMTACTRPGDDAAERALLRRDGT